MTLSPQAVEAGTAILRRGRGSAPVPIGHLPPETAPADVFEATQLQTALNELLSADGFGPVVGTKIGCTTKIMQEYLGMEHPCAGAIFASTVCHKEDSVDFASYLHVGVECEIAVTLGQPIKAADAPHSLQSVSPLVASIHAAIEIVDDRYVDFASRVPDWKTWVADNFFGAGIVLGEPITDWQSLNLANLRGTMKIKGQQVGSGFGRDIINGHPLEALVWLANHEAQRGKDLPADWIVMLGSVVQTKWVNQGDLVEVDLDHLGSASLLFC